MKPVRTRPLLALSGGAILAAGAASLWLASPDTPAVATRAAVPERPAPIASGVEEPADDLLLEPAPPRPKSREEKRFDRADRNDDGVIQQAEFLTVRKRNFDKLDVNGDGRLSFEEYAASGIAKFRAADSNGDGRLARAEFATTAPKPRKVQSASSAKCVCPPVQTAELDE